MGESVVSLFMNESATPGRSETAPAPRDRTAPLWTDQSFLRAEQYADSGNLRARQAIYDYQVPRLDIADWALGLLELSGDETVVDVGCGNGAYLSALSRSHRGAVIGLDLSLGMLRDARATLAEDVSAASRVAVAQADAQRLPLRSGSCDVALAMHMLYHVPDARAAVRELHRILRPGGRAAVVLNSSGHLAELRGVCDTAFEELGLGLRFPFIGSFRIPEGAALLSEEFGRVTEHRAGAELRITDPEPVVGYALSLNVARSTGVDPGALAAEVRAEVRRLIDETGYFRVTAAPGCLVVSS